VSAATVALHDASARVRATVRHRPLVAIVTVELTLIAALSLITVFGLHIFSPIDERADFSYVSIVAQHHRLPILGSDCISPQVAAVDHSPSGSACDTVADGSYEAFQPPLYYVFAAPLFDLGGSDHSRVELLRLFDWALFLAAIALTILFIRECWPGHASWPIIAGVLLVFLWPEFIVRAVTVSNTALELPLAQLTLWVTWRAWRSQRARSVLLAGGLFGLCLLTKLTLVYLAVPFAALLIHHARARATPRGLATAVASGLLALLVLSPWLAFNEQHYHSLTADAQAKTMQEPVLNPLHIKYTAGDLPGRNARLLTLLPQEFAPANSSGASRRALNTATKIALIALLLGAAAAAFAFKSLRPKLWLLVPLAAAVVMLNATLLLANWDLFITRYLDAALPWAAAFLAACAVAALRSTQRVALLLSAGLLAEMLIWTHYAHYIV
jgi:hypothetical protein